jgi:hypothetical protein
MSSLEKYEDLALACGDVFFAAGAFDNGARVSSCNLSNYGIL